MTGAGDEPATTATREISTSGGPEVELITMFILGPLILVEMGRGSLFAAGAGLLGGAVAAGMAKKPAFELKVVR